MSRREGLSESPEIVALRQHASALPRAEGRDDESLFGLLIASVRDYAIFMLDPGGHITTWNAGAQRIKGYSAREIIGKHFSTFYPDEDVRSGKCEFELEVAAREGRFEEEGWRVRRDGSRFWANVVISSMRDDEGVLVGFAKVTRDLTDRKKAAEEQARRLAAEERFRMLVAGVRDYAIFMLDRDGRVTTWNVGAERIKGYTAAEIIGRHMSVFYPAEDVRAGKCERELAEAIREGRFEEEGWRVRKDGGCFWANVTINSLRDEQGELVGFSKITRDLTERKRAADEQVARFAAEQANRAKDEFLAMLGHELRNPLAPIVTALQVMKLRDDGRMSKEHEILERQVRHMVRLVDDLLDISRITAGKIEIKRQVIALREVIAKAIEVVSPLLEERAHQIEVHVPPGIWVHGDEARLTQVFANLLANAAKYTDPGGHIDVEVRRSGGEVAVEVRDDGVGIAPDLLPQLFDLFVQGHQSLERSAGGLGMGLTLVRSLVKLHGGTVEARSSGAGEGSTFVVRLPAVEAPLRQTEAATSPGGQRKTDRPRRVLLVDDNVDALELMADVLVRAGHTVRTASDAAGALEAAGVFDPEVAILDIGLPVIDGYTLAARLREQQAPATPRLLALTGYGQESDRARSARAGFDHHLVKPVDVERLLALIASNA